MNSKIDKLVIVLAVAAIVIDIVVGLRVIIVLFGG